MSEDEAILFLLELGEGAVARSERVDELVTEMQESCDVTEDTLRELYIQLADSDSVVGGKEKYGLL